MLCTCTSCCRHCPALWHVPVPFSSYTGCAAIILATVWNCMWIQVTWVMQEGGKDALDAMVEAAAITASLPAFSSTAQSLLSQKRIVDPHGEVSKLSGGGSWR